MKNKHISLKDLAKELDVSISTVSRALKDHPDISDNVKNQVKKLASKYGYTPNPLAMALLKQETRMVGVIVPDLVSHFYSSVIAGIESYVKEKGYFILIASSCESCIKEIESIENLLKARVEGLLVSVSQNTVNTEYFSALNEKNIPLVFFDRICLPQQFSSVTVDNDVAAKNITKHFFEQGCRRIAMISGPRQLNISRERLAGYKEGLDEVNLDISDELVVTCDLSFNRATKATKKLLNLRTPPDAILAINDTVAFAAMKTIKGRGYKIPKDIGLAGFSDDFHSTIVDPPLTSVAHPTFEMGREAARLLFENITSHNTVKRLELNTKLAIRESSDRSFCL